MTWPPSSASSTEMAPESHAAARSPGRFEEIVAKRVEFLTGYQDAAYAERYRALVERVRAAEAERTPGMTGLAEAVARYYFKLLAYKDEYEVARLYTDGSFREALERAVRGRLQARIPPRAAAADAARSRQRPADQEGAMVPG